MMAENYRIEKKNAKLKVKKFRKKRNNAKNLENLVESHLLKFQKAWKDLERDEGKKVQKREEKCKKDWHLEGTAVKGIFESSWSWMKVGKYTKEKKNAKRTGISKRFEKMQKSQQ